MRHALVRPTLSETHLSGQHLGIGMQCCRRCPAESRDHLVRISGCGLQVVRFDLKPGQVDQGLAYLQVSPGTASSREGRLEVAPGRLEVTSFLVRKSKVVKDAAADPLPIGVALIEERQRLLEPSDGVDVTPLPT